MHRLRGLWVVMALLVSMLTGCTVPAPATGAEQEPKSGPGLTPTRQPSPTPNLAQQPSPTPALISIAPAASATPGFTATTTPCPPQACTYTGWSWLQRPIAPPGQTNVDPTYRFGSTQGGQRDPHHGVEFLNSAGTPVLAAAGGKVIVAGDDRQTLYGPYSYFYGNLVVIEHRIPAVGRPVFTLYAHLSEIVVQAGQMVEAGEEIGKVGMTGVATGSHLHFEVRLDENTYSSARNPELWLEPLQDSGQSLGALAGRILTSGYYRLNISSIVLEHLDGPQGAVLSAVYVTPYEEQALRGLPPWHETFAANDLPPGWYRVSFVQNGMQNQRIQVYPGELTVIEFDLREP